MPSADLLKAGRNIAIAGLEKIIMCASISLQFGQDTGVVTQRYELELQLVSVLSQMNNDWLPQQPQLVTSLLKIWVSENFQERHRKIVSSLPLSS